MKPTLALRGILPIVLLALILASPSWLRAADGKPPERLSYQGYLVDANGNQLGSASTGPRNYDVIFRIFNDQALSGSANRLWSEQQTVTVDKGYFSVMLGEGAAVSSEPRPALSTVFTNTVDLSDRFVEITIKGIGANNSDTTLSPRMRLLTAPYAFTATYAISAGKIVNSANSSIVTVTGSRVAINNTNPGSELDVTGTGTFTGLKVNGTAAVTGTSTLADVSASSITASGNVTVGTSGKFVGYGTIPVGGIIMWKGTVSEIPDGWALCNGQNGTPDLQGRFVLGAGTGTGLTARTVGSTGGAESVTLTVANMPSHNHTTTISNDGNHQHKYTDHFFSGDGYTYTGTQGAVSNGENNWPGTNYAMDGNNPLWYRNMTTDTAGSHSHTATVSSSGSGTSFSALPPYYVLAYIMRTK